MVGAPRVAGPLRRAAALCLALAWGASACSRAGGPPADAGRGDGYTADAIAAPRADAAQSDGVHGARVDSDAPGGGTVEVCGSGIDEDGDGLVDCADPDCRGALACHETACGDGLDNDADGDTDCVDPDCEASAACTAESCATYFDCLMAAGCNCTPGADCPPRGSLEANECMNACGVVPDCAQACYAALSPQTQLALTELRTCAQQACAERQADCFSGPCLEPFAQCYFTGALSCLDFLGECVDGCGNDPHCVGGCVSEMSPQGYIDYTHWVQCLWSVCDADGNHAADSRACLALGGFVACADAAPGCVPPASPGTCGPFVDCTLHCENLGDLLCVSSCLVTAGLDETARPAAAAVVRCAIEACGTGPLELTRACVQDALETACAAPWAACQALAPSPAGGGGGQTP